MPSQLMPRMLFALVGVAIGLLGALTVEAIVDPPGAKQREIEAQLASADEQRNTLSRELGHAKEKISTLESDLADAVSATRDLPSLGALSAFKVGTVFSGPLESQPGSQRLFDEALRQRLEDLGIPLVDEVTLPEHAALLVTLETTDPDLRIGGSLHLNVAVRGPSGAVVFLTSNSIPLLAHDWRDLASQVLLAIDSVAIAFKREWQAAVRARAASIDPAT